MSENLPKVTGLNFFRSRSGMVMTDLGMTVSSSALSKLFQTAHSPNCPAFPTSSGFAIAAKFSK
jgi:hypothetical protein